MNYNMADEINWLNWYLKTAIIRIFPHKSAWPHLFKNRNLINCIGKHGWLKTSGQTFLSWSILPLSHHLHFPLSSLNYVFCRCGFLSYLRLVIMQTSMCNWSVGEGVGAVLSRGPWATASKGRTQSIKLLRCQSHKNWEYKKKRKRIKEEGATCRGRWCEVWRGNQVEKEGSRDEGQGGGKRCGEEVGLETSTSTPKELRECVLSCQNSSVDWKDDKWQLFPQCLCVFGRWRCQFHFTCLVTYAPKNRDTHF